MTFKDLKLNEHIQKALETAGFVTPTEIQEKAIPMLLSSEPVDFHGQAQTGTGKTLAFGLPLIHKINPKLNKVQALIVAPTRELVLQICDSLKPILNNSEIKIGTIYGGVSIVRQFQDLKRGVHIVVGTPGRINDHLKRRTLSLNDLKILVLDEADIMLDMGFKEEIDDILKFAPQNRQIWLFSATVKPGISQIKNSHMKNVMAVKINPKNISKSNTKQFYCIAPLGVRLEALCRIIDSDTDFYGFIFCPTKILTSDIAEKLSANGYNVNTLHGDMDQSLRTRVINQFRDKKFSILVATDVAARGLDVPDITHVINYYLPQDQESYIHRIGRTGRAGKTGIAISFVNNSELRYIKRLSEKFNINIEKMNVPTINDIIKIQISRVQKYIAGLTEKEIYKKLHLDELNKNLSLFSHEDLKNIVLNIISEKFLERFENISDDKFIEQNNSNRTQNNKICEIMIGLGSDDGISFRDIKHYLMKEGNLANNLLLKIKVLRKRSFVMLPKEKANGLMTALQNGRLQGKKARISIVEPSF